VLAEGADVCLLDNMEPDMLREAVLMNTSTKRGPDHAGSLGQCQSRHDQAIAETGVDYISTSKITMAAPTLDIGLDMEIG
jgi:nicotinate-nucleotide pyrophosphorylase (carboxylating)